MDILHAAFNVLTADSGRFYGAVSGWVSDLSLLGGAALVYRKHNCHVRRCWRLGHHPAGDHVVCRRHHPSVPNKAPTAADVAASLEDDGEIEWALDDEQPTRGEVRDVEIDVADTAGLSDEWGTDHGDDDEPDDRRRRMGFR